jgi:hypothetical protein
MKAPMVAKAFAPTVAGRLAIAANARYPEPMPGDAKLVLLMAALHVVGLVFVAVLLVMFLRSDTAAAYRPPEDPDGGGGGNDRLTPRDVDGPSGDGLPLPDASPARVRLRSHDRLRDLLPRPTRRRSDEPERAPRRVPTDG